MAPFTIDRISAPSLDEFEANYRNPPRPVVMEGVTEGWPALDWTVAGLQARYGHRKIPVVPTYAGTIRRTADTGLRFYWMSFGDYLAAMDDARDPECYMICPIGDVLPELAADLMEPAFVRGRPYRQQTRLFFSSIGTSAPLHYDLLENFFVQLVGRKRFRLCPPQNSPWLYANPIHSGLPNFSRFDPEAPDFQSFPLAQDAPPIELVLNPGDVLYLPSRWWHETRALDLSMSANYWWADGALRPVVLFADWVKRIRGLEIYSISTPPRTPGAN